MIVGWKYLMKDGLDHDHRGLSQLLTIANYRPKLQDLDIRMY